MNRSVRPFRDRTDAGEQLSRLLRRRHFDHPVVLGIPRGGVAVSVEVARALGAEHGVLVARKLGSPIEPELAIGAITAGGTAFVDEELAESTGANSRYIEAEKARQRAEAERREEAFNHRRRPELQGRTVIVVDDGVATGATAIAAVRDAKVAGASRVVFAVPVGPPSTLAELRHEADEVVCLRQEPDFFAVGQFYREFEPVSDAEVKHLLDSYRTVEPAAPA